MTDRYSALTIVLDRDIRDDDAEPLINAIRMLRGVLSVEPHISIDLGEHVAAVRLRHEMWDKLRDAVFPRSADR